MNTYRPGPRWIVTSLAPPLGNGLGGPVRAFDLNRLQNLRHFSAFLGVAVVFVGPNQEPPTGVLTGPIVGCSVPLVPNRPKHPAVGRRFGRRSAGSARC